MNDMSVEIMSSKLHRVMCTQARLDYIGSVTIDRDWMDEAGLIEGQKVDVLNISNGERLTTYCISGKNNTGILCMNGAAAHKVKPGDPLIIIAYAMMPIEVAKNFKPKVLLFDDLHEDRYYYDQDTQTILFRNNTPPTYQLLSHEKHGQTDIHFSLPKAWDLATQVFWDTDRYVLSLEELFKSYKVESILDVSGGTGFPSINLKKKGWNITYADGCQDMYQYAMQKSQGTLQGHCCKWQELTSTIGSNLFDAVICRGNSLPYVDSWQSISSQSQEDRQHYIDSNTVLHNLHLALKQFYLSLRPGGILIVDRSDLVTSGRHVLEQDVENILGFQNVQIRWEFLIDPDNNSRDWYYTITADSHSHTLQLRSFLLTEPILDELLANAGFQSSRPIQLEGETIYKPYLAQKSATI